MKKNKYHLLLIIFCSACGETVIQTPPTESQLQAIPCNVKIKRLEKAFFEAKNKTEIERFLKRNTSFTKKYLKQNPEKIPTDYINYLENVKNNSSLRTIVKKEAETCWLSFWKKYQVHLLKGLKRIKYYYPDYITPTIATFITGMETLAEALYVDKQQIIIGIDCFIGQQSTYKLKKPDYILKHYHIDNILPRIFAKIGEQYIEYKTKDKTLLNEMLYYGKLCFFIKTILPELPEHIILGYTEKELNLLQESKIIIWEHFMSQRLFYTEKRKLKEHYMAFQNHTYRISFSCPDRVGKWLGFEIVKSYMKHHPEITLKKLMEEPNTLKIFLRCKYIP